MTPSANRQFDTDVGRLNVTTVQGHRAGLEGRYTVKIVGQPGSATIELALLDATDLHLIDANSKSRAVSKQMGPPPTAFR
jgi:hypothetical protein